jgi:exoribonuclease II
MLPEILSENIASLDTNKNCFAFVMDMAIHMETKQVHMIRIYQACVQITQNFIYESDALMKHSDYKLLSNITKTLDPSIIDSHDIVAFWMMKFNHIMATNMQQHAFGVFRITSAPKSVETDLSSQYSPDIQTFLRIWENSISGKYIAYSPNVSDYTHNIMNVPSYIHFTSPIRRMVDVLNQLLWITNMIRPPNISESGSLFLQYFLQNIDKINLQTKDIRKIQTNCTLLDIFQNKTPEPNTKYEGILLDIEQNKKGIYKYLVYSLSHKHIFPFSSETLFERYSKIEFGIHIFEKEKELNQKIRLYLHKSI